MLLALIFSVCGAAQGSATAQSGPTISVNDPRLKMEMEKVPLPPGWKGEGTTLRGVACNTNFPEEVLRAESADGLSGFQVMPEFIWFASDNPAAYVSMGVDHCRKLGDMAPSEVLLQVAGSRPNAKVVSVQQNVDNPAFKQIIERTSRQIAALPSAAGPGSYSGREDVVVVEYTLKGHQEEEMFLGDLTKAGNMTIIMPPVGSMQRAGRAMLYTYTLSIRAVRAPKGKIPELRKVLGQTMGTRQQNPQWVQAENQFEKQIRDDFTRQTNAMMARNQAAFEAEESRFKAQSAATLANTQRTMAQAQAQNDQLQRTGQDFIDYLAGNQYYLNPATGQTYTITAGDGKTYMNQGGDVIRTTNGYDQLSMPSHWVELQAINH
jgi:hypothetical protein